MGYFDDIPGDAPAAGGFFDDLPTIVPASGGSSVAPVSRAQVSQQMPESADRLPGLWDVTVGGQKVRAVKIDGPGGKPVYSVRTNDGGTAVVRRRRDNGELFLEPLTTRQFQEAEAASLGPLQAFGIAADKGAEDVANAAVQLFQHATGIGDSKKLDNRLKDEAQAFDVLASVRPGAAYGGRITGGVVGTAPLLAVAGTSIPALAATGGVSGALAPVENGGENFWRDKMVQTGVGMGLGVAIPKALTGIGNAGLKGIQKASNLIHGTKVMRQNPAQIKVIIEQQLAAAGEDTSRFSPQMWDDLIRLVQQNPADSIDPAAALRLSRAQSLPIPVPLTRGMATQRLADQKAEDMVSKIRGGEPLVQRLEETNRALIQNFDDLISRSGAETTAPDAAGEALSDALERAAAISRANVNDLYNSARAAGELEAPVDITPILDVLSENQPKIRAGLAPELNAVLATLEKQGIVSYDDTGRMVIKQAKINDVENLYQSLADLANPADPRSMRLVGQVKTAINKATEGVDAGDMYRAARAARLEHAKTFEDPRIVSSLTGMRSRTDRIVNYEDAFNKTVIQGGLEDLRLMQRAMLSRDPTQREAANKALANIKGSMIEFLRDAGRSGAATNGAGDPLMSGANLLAGVKKIGRGNLQTGWKKIELVLGQDQANVLRNLVDTARTVTNKVPGAVNNSNTATHGMDILTMLGPGGSAASAAKNAANAAMGARATKATVESAQNPAAAVVQARTDILDKYAPLLRQLLQGVEPQQVPLSTSNPLRLFGIQTRSAYPGPKSPLFLPTLYGANQGGGLLVDPKAKQSK